MAFANSKGGVGKSTLSVHYAVWLHEQGVKVAFIDADKQSSSTPWIEAVESGIGTFKLTTEDEIIDHKEAIANSVDSVVIDGPAGDSGLTRAILLIADKAYLPCCPSELDLSATLRAIQVVKQAQKVRGGAPVAFFVPNRIKVGQPLSRELLELGSSLGLPFSSYVRDRSPYADAASQKSVVWRMGPHARFAAEEINTLFKELRSYDTQ